MRIQLSFTSRKWNLDKIFDLKFHIRMLVAFTTKTFWKFPSFGKPFSDPLIYFIKVENVAENDKFSNKNDMFPA